MLLLKRIRKEFRYVEQVVKESVDSWGRDSGTNWGAALGIFIFLFGVMLLLTIKFGGKGNPLPIRIILGWFTIGFLFLIIDLVALLLREKKGKEFSIHYLYRLTVITNLPLFAIMNVFSWMLSRNEIDADTYVKPFIIICVDLVAVMAMLGSQPLMSRVVNWITDRISDCWDNVNVDIMALLVFAILIKVIFSIVNRLSFSLIKRKDNEKITEKQKAILQEQLVPEAPAIDLMQVSKESENAKKEMESVYLHDYQYILSVINKFQLGLLILFYFIAAFFPENLGMKAHDNLQSDFINVITMITLIMLYLDKSRQWDSYRLKENKESAGEN